jgi:hypothetical protein
MNMLLSPKMKSRRFKHHLAEINELIRMGYTHQEIVNYLRESRDLDLPLNTFKSYLQRSKQTKIEASDSPVVIQNPIVESKFSVEPIEEKSQVEIENIHQEPHALSTIPESFASKDKRIKEQVAELMRKHR